MITTRAITLRHLLLAALALLLAAAAGAGTFMTLDASRGPRPAPCDTFHLDKLHDPAFVRALNRHYDRRDSLDMILINESGQAVMCFERRWR